MKRLQLIGLVLTIGSAVGAIISFALGGLVPRWVMFTWPALVLVWALIVLTEQNTHQRNRKTIDWQAKVIRNQAELLGQILTQDIDGRD